MEPLFRPPNSPASSTGLSTSDALSQGGQEVMSLASSSLCSHRSASGELGCWICMDGPSDEKGALFAPCPCSKLASRMAHSKCLARWQLQSAGTKRETNCEFCGCVLPDWREPLTPSTGANAPAIMNVNFGGMTYSFQVKPGPAGYHEFTHAIRRAFHLPADAELNITYTCDEPSTGEEAGGSLLTLQGPGTYDAAVHCAAVSAARRNTHHGGSGASSPTRRNTTRASAGNATGSNHSSPSSSSSTTSAATTTAPNQQHSGPCADGNGKSAHMLGSLGRRLRNALDGLFS